MGDYDELRLELISLAMQLDEDDLERGIAALRSLRASAPPTLHPDDLAILRALYRAQPRSLIQADIAAETWGQERAVSVHGVKRRAPYLLGEGFVDKPHGPKGGLGITKRAIDLFFSNAP